MVEYDITRILLTHLQLFFSRIFIMHKCTIKLTASVNQLKSRTQLMSLITKTSIP